MAAPRKKTAAPKQRFPLVVQTRISVDERDDNGDKITRQYDVPSVAQAASLALALLTEGGSKNWAEFMGDNDEFRVKAFKKVFITEEQAELLDLYPNMLTWISRDSTPASTIVVCLGCEQFSVTLSTTPTSCKISPRCDGKPVRVARAPRPKKEAAPKAEASASEDT